MGGVVGHTTGPTCRPPSYHDSSEKAHARVSGFLRRISEAFRSVGGLEAVEQRGFRKGRCSRAPDIALDALTQSRAPTLSIAPTASKSAGVSSLTYPPVLCTLV